MPKIRVEIDVPDGEKCWGCCFYAHLFGECRLFLDRVDSDEDTDGRRLTQCIAAEVKEKAKNKPPDLTAGEFNRGE